MLIVRWRLTDTCNLCPLLFPLKVFSGSTRRRTSPALFPRHQMRKATRHKCTSLFCLGVVVVPLIVFVLSAFLAIWLWLLEADLAGCFKPGGEDFLPPSPPPPGPLDEEELGSGSRQLAIGAGASASHANATSGAASERPICSYYEWCALGRKSRPATQPTCLRARALCAGCCMCLATSSASASPASNPCPGARPPSCLTCSSLLGALR